MAFALLGEEEEAYKELQNEVPNLIVEELEKIKTEIGEAYSYFDSADVHWGFNICRYIIDEHIAELKGENKSEQADTEFNHEAFYEFLLNVINLNEMEKYRSMFLSNGEIVN